MLTFESLLFIWLQKYFQFLYKSTILYTKIRYWFFFSNFLFLSLTQCCTLYVMCCQYNVYAIYHVRSLTQSQTIISSKFKYIIPFLFFISDDDAHPEWLCRSRNLCGGKDQISFFYMTCSCWSMWHRNSTSGFHLS